MKKNANDNSESSWSTLGDPKAFKKDFWRPKAGTLLATGAENGSMNVYGGVLTVSPFSSKDPLVFGKVILASFLMSQIHCWGSCFCEGKVIRLLNREFRPSADS